MPMYRTLQVSYNQPIIGNIGLVSLCVMCVDTGMTGCFRIRVVDGELWPSDIKDLPIAVVEQIRNLVNSIDESEGEDSVRNYWLERVRDSESYNLN